MPTQRYTGIAWQSEPTQLTGDLSFVGVDTKTPDPALLQQGFIRRLQNYRILQGSLRPRMGMIPPPNINSVSYGTIFGEGDFFDPNDNEFFCVGNSSGVYVTSPGQAPVLVPIQAGQGLDGPVRFIQAFNQLFCFRGLNEPVLYWNGNTASSFVTLPAPQNSFLQTIPNASYAEYVYSTLYVPLGKDSVAISQVNDYTSYFTALSTLQVNSGQDDGLVRILSWVNGSVLFFKQQSVFILVNANQGIATISNTGVITANPNVYLQQISDHIGMVGYGALARYGTEVMFMDASGIFKISQVFEGQPQVAAIPCSWPIKHYFDRINFNAGAGIVGISHRDYVYFAVPLDANTRNNALLVYNIQYDRWEGIDTFGDPNFYADKMVLSTVSGEKRILLIDEVRGIVTLYEEGLYDITAGFPAGFGVGWFWIPTYFKSRGYALNDGDTRVRFKTAETRLSGWQPSYSINVYPEGPSNSGASQSLIANRMKSNTAYRLVGQPAWTTTNANSDWSLPYREDYTIYLGSGFYPDNGGSGVVFETRQPFLERFRVRTTSNSCQLEVINNQGTLDIESIQFEGMPTDRSEKSWY